MSKTIKPVKAWAVVRIETGGIEHWPDALYKFEQYDVFTNKSDAQKTVEIWTANTGESHKVIPVLISPIKKK